MKICEYCSKENKNLRSKFCSKSCKSMAWSKKTNNAANVNKHRLNMKIKAVQYKGRKMLDLFI